MVFLPNHRQVFEHTNLQKNEINNLFDYYIDLVHCERLIDTDGDEQAAF